MRNTPSFLWDYATRFHAAKAINYDGFLEEERLNYAQYAKDHRAVMKPQRPAAFQQPPAPPITPAAPPQREQGFSAEAGPSNVGRRGPPSADVRLIARRASEFFGGAEDDGLSEKLDRLSVVREMGPTDRPVRAFREIEGTKRKRNAASSDEEDERTQGAGGRATIYPTKIAIDPPCVRCAKQNLECVQKAGNVRQTGSGGPCYLCAASKLKCVLSPAARLPKVTQSPKNVPTKAPPTKKRRLPKAKSKSEVGPTDDEGKPII